MERMPAFFSLNDLGSTVFNGITFFKHKGHQACTDWRSRAEVYTKGESGFALRECFLSHFLDTDYTDFTDSHGKNH